MSWIKEAFGEYLDQRGFLDEAGTMYLAGGALEKSQQVYIKNLNVEMSLAVLAKRQLSAEETL